MKESFIEWCNRAHAETNHLYHNYIPYQFHLDLVRKVTQDYKHVYVKLGFKHNVIEYAAAGHDLIEDTRKTYNDVFKQLYYSDANEDDAKMAIEIIFAVTNNTGRNRDERADNAYYIKIRKTPGAVFIKLCDRIANVRFGKLVGGSMLNVYKKEQEKFIEKLFTTEDGYFDKDTALTIYGEMINELNNLLNI